MIKRILVAVFALFLTQFIAINFYIAYKTDISLEPVVIDSANTERPPVYLVNYADGPEVFYQNQNTLAMSAINHGIDFILMYRKHHISKEFAKKHSYILGQERGAGYWLWKPWVILDALNKAPENAIIVYLDSGFCIKGNIQPLLDLTRISPMIFVKHDDIGTTVQSITQKNTLLKMHCNDEKCRTSGHIWGAVSIYKNVKETRDFVLKWLDWCSIPDVLMNAPLVTLVKLPAENLIESKELKHHNHDEAILSILCYKHPEHKMILPLSELGKMDIMTWHHRHQSRENLSLMPYTKKVIRNWMRKMYWLWTYPVTKIKKAYLS